MTSAVERGRGRSGKGKAAAAGKKGVHVNRKAYIA